MAKRATKAKDPEVPIVQTTLSSQLRYWYSVKSLGARPDSALWFGLADEFAVQGQDVDLSASLVIYPNGAPKPSWLFEGRGRDIEQLRFQRLAGRARSGLLDSVLAFSSPNTGFCGESASLWLETIWRCLWVRTYKEEDEGAAGQSCIWILRRLFAASAEICLRLGNESQDIEIASARSDPKIASRERNGIEKQAERQAGDDIAEAPKSPQPDHVNPAADVVTSTTMAVETSAEIVCCEPVQIDKSGDVTP